MDNAAPISDAQAKMVCLGMDCLRIALGMDPVNFDADQVRDLINLRIAQYFERAPFPGGSREE